MTDEKKVAGPVTSLVSKGPGAPANAVTAALAEVAAGERVQAPAGMNEISVGGMQFSRDGDGFQLPAPLVAAAKEHIKSFVDAAKRKAKVVEAEAARLLAEADIPGRIKALEQRLVAIEEMLGRGR